MITEANMQHGHDYRGGDLAGWIVTEKYDGCRAYWDGASLWSRGGIMADLPQAWRDALPAGVALDCELYAGPGGRYRASVAMRWGRFADGMRLMVFDAPGRAGGYEDRMRAVDAMLAGNQIAVPVARVVAESTDHALAMMQAVVARGGEGLMARKPSLAYVPGRTREVLKVKP